MDDALVDVFLYQVIIGGRVNGTFTFKAYDDIVKELVEKFHMKIDRIRWKIDKRHWRRIFMNAMTYLKTDWVVLDGMIL